MSDTDNLDDTLGSRLKRARTQKGWSQRRLAEEAGVSQSVITKAERGEIDTTSKTAQIAEALGVTAGWLMDGGTYLLSIGRPETLHELDMSVAWIPEFSRNLDGDDMLVERYHPLRRDFLQQERLDPSNLGAVTVMGQSAAPDLVSGDLAFFDLTRNTLDEGMVGVYAIGLGGEIHLREVARDIDGIVIRSAFLDTREQMSNKDIRVGALEILGEVVMKVGAFRLIWRSA